MSDSHFSIMNQAVIFLMFWKICQGEWNLNCLIVSEMIFIIVMCSFTASQHSKCYFEANPGDFSETALECCYHNASLAEPRTETDIDDIASALNLK